VAQGTAILKGSVESGGNLDHIKLTGFTTQELLIEMLLELHSIRLATVALACDGGHYKPKDFNPDHNRTTKGD